MLSSGLTARTVGLDTTCKPQRAVAHVGTPPKMYRLAVTATKYSTHTEKSDAAIFNEEGSWSAADGLSGYASDGIRTSTVQVYMGLPSSPTAHERASASTFCFSWNICSMLDCRNSRQRWTYCFRLRPGVCAQPLNWDPCTYLTWDPLATFQAKRTEYITCQTYGDFWRRFCVADGQ